MRIAPILDEWNEYAAKKALIPRDLPLDVVIGSSKNKIVTLTGVRRSGKSSLLMLILQRLISKGESATFVNAEDSRLKNEPDLLDQVIKRFGDEGFLLIDEITAAKDWDGWLARMHELAKDHLHIVVTSSRSNIRTPSRPLRGRSVYFDVLPLSYQERLRFTGVKIERTTAGTGKLERALEDHLRYGGFPEVVLQRTELERVRILSEYQREILALDVAGATGTDPALVDLFGKYLLQSPYFSATACLNFLKSVGFKIGKDKILELEKAAGDSMLFHFLQIHSMSVKDRTQYPRKVYAGDVGLHYAILGTGDMGRRMENLVCLELMRKMLPGEQLRYWKDRSGAEVDFVVLRGLEAVKAVQVCYDLANERTLRRELTGLSKCSAELKAKYRLLINMDRDEVVEHEGVEIKMLPLLDWLMLSSATSATLSGGP